MQGLGVSRQVRDCERAVVDRKEALAFVEQLSFKRSARSKSAGASAVKKFSLLEIFRELHPKFPGTDSE
jgi:hypothetical protein